MSKKTTADSIGISSFADLASSGRAPKWEEKAEWYKFDPSKWCLGRLVGKGVKAVRHWIPTGGKKSKSFPILCLNFDIKKSQFMNKKKCPFCQHDQEVDEKYQIGWQSVIFSNIIPRKLQKKLSRKENPVRAVSLSSSVAKKIGQLVDRNKGVEPYDPKHGYDLEFLYNPNATPTEMYNVQQGEKTKLSKDEMKFEVYDFIKLIKMPTEEEVEDIYERFYKNKKKGKSSSSSSDSEDNSASSSNESEEVSGSSSSEEKKSASSSESGSASSSEEPSGSGSESEETSKSSEESSESGSQSEASASESSSGSEEASSEEASASKSAEASSSEESASGSSSEEASLEEPSKSKESSSESEEASSEESKESSSEESKSESEEASSDDFGDDDDKKGKKRSKK